jgi:hypothetical protein
MSDVPLPEPWDYCYEWDGPYGTRKFSTASHNGNRPNRSVPIYTADQMHAHAAAVSADLSAEIARLREALQQIIVAADMHPVHMEQALGRARNLLKGASHE